MIALSTLQTEVTKWSKRKHGASTDPHTRLILIEQQIQKLHDKPQDVDSLAQAFLYLLDYARLIKVSADDLLFCAEKRNELTKMRLEHEEKVGI